jgi:LPXTG-motif cell wall-anchored protein
MFTQGTTAMTASTTTLPGTVTMLGTTTTTIARSLPRTGSDRWGPLFGLASLTLGGTLVRFARRRHSIRAARTTTTQ